MKLNVLFLLAAIATQAIGQEAHKCKTSSGFVYQDRECQVPAQTPLRNTPETGQRKQFAWKERATSDCKNLLMNYAKNQYLKSALQLPQQRVHELAQKNGVIDYKNVSQFSNFYTSDATLDEKTNQATVRGAFDIMNANREMILHSYQCTYDNGGAFFRDMKVDLFKAPLGN